MYALINLKLGVQPGQALIRRDKLPRLGSRFTVGGTCWEVVEARYGFRPWSGVEGWFVCSPCA